MNKKSDMFYYTYNCDYTALSRISTFVLLNFVSLQRQLN